MSRDQPPVARRTVLGAVGAGTAIALAGCLGGDDENGPTDDSQEDGNTAVDSAEPHEPTQFPEGESCTVCNMITEEYPEWNTQLITEGETRMYFCSAGCLSAYLAEPEVFDGDDEPIEHIWVTDYDSGELIEGAEAYYVRIDDPDHIDDVMRMNPTPFEVREGAEALINELNDEQGAEYNPEDAIITFDDFDYELGVYYRSNFLNDEHDSDDGAGHNGDDDGHNH